MNRINSTMTESLDDFYDVFLTFSQFSYLFMIGSLYFLFYYKKVVDKKPTLICKNKEFRKFLLVYCKETIEKRIFWTFWALGSLRQTILANYIRATIPNLKYKREMIILLDQGEISLDWYKENEIDFTDKKPIVMILGGVTSHSQTEYCKSLLLGAYSEDAHFCVFNNRSRGGNKLKTPRLYCVSNSEDLEFVCNYLKNKYPKNKLICIGISLGSNVIINPVICNYLSNKGDLCLIDASMLISPCYCFFDCYDKLESNFLYLKFNQYLASLAKEILIENRSILELNKNLDYDLILKSKTFRDLDESFNRRMWNFKKLDDYLKHSSLKERIKKIRKPTLFLSAADDMFTPNIPIDEFNKSTHSALVLTEKGGHVAFVDNQLPMINRIFYVEKLCKNFLDGLIKLDKNNKFI